MWVAEFWRWRPERCLPSLEFNYTRWYLACCARSSQKNTWGGESLTTMALSRNHDPCWSIYSWMRGLLTELAEAPAQLRRITSMITSRAVLWLNCTSGPTWNCSKQVSGLSQGNAFEWILALWAPQAAQFPFYLWGRRLKNLPTYTKLIWMYS